MLRVRSRRLSASAIAITLFFTTLALLPSPGGSGIPSGPNPPLGLHLSYMDDPTTAVITWHTAGPSTSKAEWGTALGPPYPSQATGLDYATAGGTHLHTVNLTGLVPGTKYYYRIGDAAMGSWFGQGSFRAAPPKGASDTFTFVSAGDWGNFTQSTQTSAAIAKRNPNLFLAAGDLYYSHDEPPVRSVYEKWMQFGQSTFVMPAVGNHETDNAGSTNTPSGIHCAFSNLIGNERTYALTWGNTFFVTMDWGPDTAGQTDGVDGTPNNCDGVHGTAAIRTWVDAKLAAADADPTIRWKVVYHHFPCYDTTTTGFAELCPTDGLPDQIEDILINRHVDLVLAGHDHTYGRTHPVHFKTVAQTGNNYDTPGYPIYFILGTGGQSGTGTCRVATWMAACQAATPARGYGWFQVSPTTIRYEFVENAAGVIDSFTLTKTPSVGLAVAADSSTARIQPGQTGSTNVTVLGTSAVPVSLTLSGCPTGATCAFTPPSGIPRFTSALTVATTSATPEGNYRITITASNGSASASAPFDLTIAKRVTRTYQRGDGGSYSETDDAYIYSTSPNSNFGGLATLLVDGEKCIGTTVGICKTVLKFPQLIGPNSGQIPLGSRILTATLQLHMTNAGDTADLFQLIENWSETTVSWNSFATPGFPRKVERAFPMAPVPPAIRWLSLDVTVVVQNWAEGDPNYGFFLSTTSGDGADYDSSDPTSTTNHPILTVTYEAPVQPSRDPRLWPFTSDSVWNLPIGAAASYIPAGIAQATAYGMTTDPDVLMLSPGAPITPVYLNSDAWSGGSRCDAQGGVLFEAPIPSGFIVPGATPTYTPNHAAAILDEDGTTLFQGQPFTHCTADGNNTIWWYQNNERLNGTGVTGGHGGSNLSSIGGTIRLGELVPGGTIRHAMKVLLDAQANLYFNASTGGFRWPAMRADVCASACYGGANSALRMGSLLALPASVNVNTMGLETDAAKILARAFQDYGAYVVDNTAWSVYGIAVELSPAGNVEQEFANRWGFSMTPASKNVNWSRDMDRIFGALSVVDNWDFSKWQTVSASAGTLGAGLGAPRVAWAPPLGAMPAASTFDFSLSTSPPSGLVSLPGGSMSTNVTAKRTFGPTHSVQYSCANLPPGSYCTFTPPAGSPTCNTNLVLATSLNTPAGTYNVNVQATDGTTVRTSGFALTVGDPVLAYDMESLTADGRMADLSGHGNHGTISGTTDVIGKIGHARGFDGGTDEISAIAAIGGETHWTIALWVEWNDGPNLYEHAIGLGDGHDATFWFSATTVAFKTTDISGNAAVDRALSSSITTGNWYHLAASFDGTTVTTYLNGVVTASVAASSTTIRSNSIKVGSSGSQVSNFFSGIIDEVLIYNRTLKASDIAGLAPTPPPSVGPLVSYDMENLTTDGSMKDLSGHANHGIMTGTIDADGRIGRARSFDGGTDKIATAPGLLSGLTHWTIALWVEWRDGANLYEHPISLGVGHDATFWFSGNTVALKTTDGSGNTVVDRGLSSSVVQSTWYHLAATFDGTTVTAYLDGIESFSVAGPATTIRSNSIKIGTSGAEVDNFFNGSIDEVLVESRALNASEIAGLVPTQPPSTGPILSYDLDSLTADGRMKDLSGNGRHGTITGTTDVAGVVGRARRFDGGADKIAASAPVSGLTRWTIALWIQWDDGPNAYEHPIGIGASHDATFWFTGTTVAFKTTDAFGATVVDSGLSSTIATGMWYHLAATFDGTTVTAYLDGIESFSVAGPATTIRSNSIKIGTSGAEVDNFFNGSIDEVLVESRALNASEIAGLVSSDAFVHWDFASSIAPLGSATNLGLLEDFWIAVPIPQHDGIDSRFLSARE